MEEKIEKIEGAYDLPVIKKKLNQVIDYLNSESRPEGNYKLTIEDLEDITKLIKEQNNDSVSIEYLMQYCGYLNTQPQAEEVYSKTIEPLERGRVYKGVPIAKSTPEQKEELVEIKKKLNGISVEYNIIDRIDVIWEEIENLLSERERWAIHTFLKDTASYNSFHNGRPRTMRNGLSGEGFEVRVSKLTTK